MALTISTGTSRRVTAAIVATGCWLCSMAQHQSVVIDAETGVPVREVQVFVNSMEGKRIVTDWQGTFEIPDTARNLTLCHTRYERRTIDIGEATDTIRLLPNINRLNELVVKGKRPEVSSQMMASIGKVIQEAAAAQPKTGVSFDFFSIFNYKKRKRTKKRIESIKDY